MFEALNTASRILAAIIWAIVGFIFWIPLLVRVFSVQTALLIAAAFTNKKDVSIEKQMEKAIGFYSNGFAVIFAPTENSRHGAIFGWEDLERALPQILYTLGFYIISLTFILII